MANQSAKFSVQFGNEMQRSAQRFSNASNEKSGIPPKISIEEADRVAKERLIQLIIETRIKMQLIAHNVDVILPTKIAMFESQIKKTSEAIKSADSPSETLIMQTLLNTILFGLVTTKFLDWGKRFMLLDQSLTKIYLVLMTNSILREKCGGQLPPGAPKMAADVLKTMLKGTLLAALGYGAAEGLTIASDALFDSQDVHKTPNVVTTTRSRDSVKKYEGLDFRSMDYKTLGNYYVEMGVLLESLEDKEAELSKKLRELELVAGAKSQEAFSVINEDEIADPSLKSLVAEMKSLRKSHNIIDRGLETVAGMYVGHGMEVGMAFGIGAHVVGGTLRLRSGDINLKKSFEKLDEAAKRRADIIYARNQEYCDDMDSKTNGYRIPLDLEQWVTGGLSDSGPKRELAPTAGTEFFPIGTLPSEATRIGRPAPAECQVVEFPAAEPVAAEVPVAANNTLYYGARMAASGGGAPTAVLPPASGAIAPTGAQVSAASVFRTTSGVKPELPKRGLVYEFPRKPAQTPAPAQVASVTRMMGGVVVFTGVYLGMEYALIQLDAPEPVKAAGEGTLMIVGSASLLKTLATDPASFAQFAASLPAGFSGGRLASTVTYEWIEKSGWIKNKEFAHTAAGAVGFTGGIAAPLAIQLYRAKKAKDAITAARALGMTGSIETLGTSLLIAALCEIGIRLYTAYAKNRAYEEAREQFYKKVRLELPKNADDPEAAKEVAEAIIKKFDGICDQLEAGPTLETLKRLESDPDAQFIFTMMGWYFYEVYLKDIPVTADNRTAIYNIRFPGLADVERVFSDHIKTDSLDQALDFNEEDYQALKKVVEDPKNKELFYYAGQFLLDDYLDPWMHQMEFFIYDDSGGTPAQKKKKAEIRNQYGARMLMLADKVRAPYADEVLLKPMSPYDFETGRSSFVKASESKGTRERASKGKTLARPTEAQMAYYNKRADLLYDRVLQAHLTWTGSYADSFFTSYTDIKDAQYRIEYKESDEELPKSLMADLAKLIDKIDEKNFPGDNGGHWVKVCILRRWLKDIKAYVENLKSWGSALWYGDRSSSGNVLLRANLMSFEEMLDEFAETGDATLLGEYGTDKNSLWRKMDEILEELD